MQISILLSTYNGEKYLKEQLDSLFSQTFKNIEILVRDDGSTDDTLEILKTYDVKIICSSANIGIKGSFSTLLEHALENIESQYFMFCDQDDIWKKDKVEKTLHKMQELKNVFGVKPLLVHTDLKVVDDSLRVVNKSLWKHEGIDPNINSLNRLLLQNTITGCTVMINRQLAELASPIPIDSVIHDYWFGLVASYFGHIGILDESTVLYRQHTLNSVGSCSFGPRYILKKLLKKDILQKNINQANVFLQCYRNQLDSETIIMLEDFMLIESKSFCQKRKILLKHKLFKQGFIRNLGLILKI